MRCGAPGKVRRESRGGPGARVRSSGMSAALSEPARPTIKPCALACATKRAIPEASRCARSEPAFLSAVSSMMPAAPMSDAADTASKVGNASANSTRMRRTRSAMGRSAWKQACGSPPGKQPELHIVDAARRALDDRVTDRFWLHRQIADGGADRHAPGDQSHDAPRGFGIDRAKRALRRVFQVDDVGVREKRGLGFGRVAHAGKKEGHLCSWIEIGKCSSGTSRRGRRHLRRRRLRRVCGLVAALPRQGPPRDPRRIRRPRARPAASSACAT